MECQHGRECFRRRAKPARPDHSEINAIRAVPTTAGAALIMLCIGKQAHHDTLLKQPIKVSIHCPKCGENPENDANHTDDIEKCNIRRAEYPKPMILGSFCSPELLAHIVYEKYAKAVPLYRQESDLASKHICLLRATMSNWIDVAAKELLSRHYLYFVAGVI